ncbi:hypothetical protein, partial [Natrinema salifodinae]|uniref:hypothetical protein n=1 Tax=Natrinema salifodinae TaxID=1202768 RepID=UPI0019D3D3F7
LHPFPLASHRSGGREGFLHICNIILLSWEDPGSSTRCARAADGELLPDLSALHTFQCNNILLDNIKFATKVK